VPDIDITSPRKKKRAARSRYDASAWLAMRDLRAKKFKHFASQET
jgi:hypothetical protein